MKAAGKDASAQVREACLLVCAPVGGRQGFAVGSHVDDQLIHQVSARRKRIELADKAHAPT
jgi:hypothetical protein